MHHLYHLVKILLVVCREEEFEETTIVKLVYLQRLLAPGDSFILLISQSENSSLQSTSLVIMGIANQTVLDFLTCIIHTMLHHGNLGTLKEAGILPCTIPG